jgi:hypothetical protein
MSSKETARTDSSATAVFDLASSLPIEFRADIQLTALEHRQVIHTKVRSQALETLFTDARSAQYPTKLVDITGNYYMRSKPLDRAMSGLLLDGLSIQLRVVRLLQETHRERARELFAQIQIPTPLRAGCESATVPDVSQYYAVLKLVLTKPVQGSTDSDPLEKAILDLSSPVQLGPAAFLLAEAPLDKGSLETLAYMYSDRLRKITATDRELSYIEAKLSSTNPKTAVYLKGVRNSQSVSNGVMRLAIRLGAKSPAATALFAAYRDFLMRSAANGSCGDITTDRFALQEGYNALIAEFAEGGRKLTQADLTGPSLQVSARVDQIPNGAEISRGLLTKLEAFRDIEKKTGQRNSAVTSGWESDASEFLDRIEAIDTDHATCHACAFYVKVELLTSLFDLTPEGSTRTRILTRLLSFLSDDEFKDQSRIEWLYKFKLLLNLSRVPSKADADRLEQLQRTKTLFFLPGKRDDIIRAIKVHNDPVMSIYLLADRVFGYAYDMPPYY